jgi:O-acetyl-ADP-ribose deacetylase (regulator of RNase III)
MRETINNIIFEAEVNLKATSIAIPAISCGGTFKFPKKLCVQVFYDTILEYFAKTIGDGKVHCLANIRLVNIDG